MKNLALAMLLSNSGGNVGDALGGALGGALSGGGMQDAMLRGTNGSTLSMLALAGNGDLQKRAKHEVCVCLCVCVVCI
jgi:hypothetical protein